MLSEPTLCQEEEVAPFFAWLWRAADGWRPVFVPLRGPGSLWSILGWLFMLLGIWRFSRIPRLFLPHQKNYAGATVTGCSAGLGSYGMGGPGFVGIRLGSSGWLVVRLWGAAGWMRLDGKLLREDFSRDERQQHEPLESLQSLVGTRFEGVIVSQEELQIRFSGRSLTLRRDGSDVPVFRGNGQPKVLDPGLDFAELLLFSRRANLWLP